MIINVNLWKPLDSMPLANVGGARIAGIAVAPLFHLHGFSRIDPQSMNGPMHPLKLTAI